MAAHAFLVQAAVVNDDDQTLECLLDLASGVDIGGHVNVVTFAATDGAIQRVDDDHARLDISDCEDR